MENIFFLLNVFDYKGSEIIINKSLNTEKKW